jgi:hypothetical protein
MVGNWEMIIGPRTPVDDPSEYVGEDIGNLLSPVHDCLPSDHRVANLRDLHTRIDAQFLWAANGAKPNTQPYTPPLAARCLTVVLKPGTLPQYHGLLASPSPRAKLPIRDCDLSLPTGLRTFPHAKENGLTVLETS